MSHLRESLAKCSGAQGQNNPNGHSVPSASRGRITDTDVPGCLHFYSGMNVQGFSPGSVGRSMCAHTFVDSEPSGVIINATFIWLNVTWCPEYQEQGEMFASLRQIPAAIDSIKISLKINQPQAFLIIIITSGNEKSLNYLFRTECKSEY